VLLQWTRADELGWSPFGSAMVVRIAAALDAHGRVVDWQHELWSHTHSKRPGSGDGINLLGAWHCDLRIRFRLRGTCRCRQAVAFATPCHV
jgi:hypothetical protein